ncbi:hypothetical protein [Actinopolymorpha pittospori]|uniref:Uncharacterized protein n=1 Tax=Actinopolymorpha pittospori TaxID=648752 RepID=A0A927RAZ8_9ACTN|nr:hypothetical protein [Actinopolymorpha pittospori]MBE1605580.1 hypothetical protein [Actinopolymorpha pittospori]
MKLNFQVGDSTVLFRRSPWTGVESIIVDGEEQRIRDFAQANKPTFNLDRETTTSINGTTVTIRALRPRWFGGLRPHDYRVVVDGNVVLTQQGY